MVYFQGWRAEVSRPRQGPVSRRFRHDRLSSPPAARPSRTDLVTGEPGGLMLVLTLATGPAAGRAAAHGHAWRAAGASVRPRGPGPVRTRPFPRLRQWRRADRDGCRRPAEP